MQVQGEYNRVRVIRNIMNKYIDKVGISVQ